MYRIVDWNRHFENNRSRELKELSWVPMPNSHDGDGYTELLDHQDGPSHFGVWCAVVQVASKCEPRGTLVRDGARPHDAASLARMTKFPRELIAVVLPRLTNDIKWLEEIPDPSTPQHVTEISHLPAVIPHSAATFPQEGALKGREGKEGNGKEKEASADADEPSVVAYRLTDETSTPAASRPVYSASFDAWYAEYPRKVGKQAAASAFGRALPRIARARDLSTEDALKWLLAVTKVFAQSPKGQAKEFTPHPATWLNEGRYDDDPVEWLRGYDNRKPRGRDPGPGQRYQG